MPPSSAPSLPRAFVWVGVAYLLAFLAASCSCDLELVDPDMEGVWVNGVPATLTVGDGTTTVGNVNNIDNVNLYNDNTSDQFNTEMDGFTVTMTLTMTVIPDVVNSIRIGIADVGDSSYDSNLLIAGGSLQTELIANDDVVKIAANGQRTFNPLSNDDAPPSATITVTHINGQAVSAGDTVTLPNGHTVTHNISGSFIPNFVRSSENENCRQLSTSNSVQAESWQRSNAVEQTQPLLAED